MTARPADRRTGRVLAVDWGRKRFGVAVSDPSRLIAQPLVTLTRREGQRAPIAALLDLIRAHDVTELVVGLPLSLEGEEGEAAREVRTFGDALAARSGLPLTFRDERLTTSLALRSARAAGVKDRDSRARIDQMAAVAILQHFLDAQRTPGAAGRGPEDPE
jgi:putative Holliday junction resolvase